MSMMIRIRYPDGRFDMVKASHLDRLIATRQIRSFKRESGWVVLGKGPIRRQGKQVFYLGPERREPLGAWPEIKKGYSAPCRPEVLRT
jgi:hypothetical protein